MPVPDYQTMMLPLLRAFAGGARTVHDCLPALRAAFAITDEEAAELLPSGRKTLLADRAHWARTYLGKAGLLRATRRGQHEITEDGRRLLAGAPARIDVALLRALSPAFAAWRGGAREQCGDGDAPGAPGTAGAPAPPAAPAAPAMTPEEQIEGAFRVLEDALADDLLDRIRRLEPRHFERLVLDLLGAMGYATGGIARRSPTGGPGDGGIDGIIHEDALGLDAVYVQAKRQEAPVGRPAIQQFVGGLTGERATKGVFVTASAFTPEAREFARQVNQRIVLIDGEELARRMIRHGVGVRVRRTLELKAVDSDYFEEAEG